MNEREGEIVKVRERREFVFMSQKNVLTLASGWVGKSLNFHKITLL